MARTLGIIAVLLAVAIPLWADSTNTFIVATYNLENWLMMEREKKQELPKPLPEREAAVRTLASVRPDVLGVEEMGTTNDLADLRARLEEQGMSFPHWEWIEGSDSSRHVALLSRFPITKRYSRTNDTYQIGDRPMRIHRGILDVRVQVTPRYSFRAIVAHLKSKRQTDFGDEATMRLEEARLLRHHVTDILKRDAHDNILVMGDFNDLPESEAVRVLIGDEPFRLFALPAKDSKGYETTHFWKARRLFSRIDYLLLSPGMSNEYVEGSARIADPPRWLEGSDHRPVVAVFQDQDIGPAPILDASQYPWWQIALTTAVVAAAAVQTIMIYRKQRQLRARGN